MKDNIKILLDIDDTALLYDKKKKVWLEHPQLRNLIENFNVILYSGNPAIEDYHLKWKTNGFILKAEDCTPKADVLIDNDYELWSKLVNVKRYYRTIDEFLENE